MAASFIPSTSPWLSTRTSRTISSAYGKCSWKLPTTPRPAAAAAAGVAAVCGGGGGSRDNILEPAVPHRTLDDLKAALFKSLEGVNDRGMFGITLAKKSEIEELVELLELQNPTPRPTETLHEKVDGCWKLIYSTITILGAKRTKLGLREFISLGDSFQIIDAAKGKAVNVIKFNVKGLTVLSGQLSIEASYKITSDTRVDIKLESSTITPEQLMSIFRKSYDLLLTIFNPEGWLEITYVDDTLRIGRDDKRNIFVLERAELSEI